MWDQRYSTEEYAYGTEPNEFLKAQFQHLPRGKILSLAEGAQAQARMLARVQELDIEVHEDEFQYWKKLDSKKKARR
jgi:hypothetical protein